MKVSIEYIAYVEVLPKYFPGETV